MRDFVWSLEASVLWDSPVEVEDQPITSVQWVRYWFFHGEADNTRSETYVLVYLNTSEEYVTVDTRFQEVPEWVPHPPEGWDALPAEFDSLQKMKYA